MTCRVCGIELAPDGSCWLSSDPHPVHDCSACAAMRAEVARLTAERDEARDAILGIRQVAMQPGSIEARLQADPATKQVLFCALAALLGTAPNYVEVQVEVGDGDPPRRIIVTVQRAEGVTPHQARQAAEASRDRWRKLAGRLYPLAEDRSTHSPFTDVDGCCCPLCDYQRQQEKIHG